METQHRRLYPNAGVEFLPSSALPIESCVQLNGSRGPHGTHLLVAARGLPLLPIRSLWVDHLVSLGRLSAAAPSPTPAAPTPRPRQRSPHPPSSSGAGRAPAWNPDVKIRMLAGTGLPLSDRTSTSACIHPYPMGRRPQLCRICRAPCSVPCTVGREKGERQVAIGLVGAAWWPDERIHHPRHSHGVGAGGFAVWQPRVASQGAFRMSGCPCRGCVGQRIPHTTLRTRAGASDPSHPQSQTAPPPLREPRAVYATEASCAWPRRRTDVTRA